MSAASSAVCSTATTSAQVSTTTSASAPTGIVTLAAFVSPTNEYRQLARDIIGAEDFKEVYVSTPLEECERRDVKGLYARARRGEVKDFTGISAPFEAPLHPALTIDTSKQTLEESVRQVMALIIHNPISPMSLIGPISPIKNL